MVLVVHNQVRNYYVFRLHNSHPQPYYADSIIFSGKKANVATHILSTSLLGLGLATFFMPKQTISVVSG